MATASVVRNFQPSARILTRSKGDSAAGKAAYNARSRIENERTGRVYDWTSHPNEVISQHFFPAANSPEWARTRDGYWNGVERRENRTDSQLAMDWVIPLPHEMEADPKHALMPLTDLIRENFQRSGYTADLVFHPAHDHGDDRNFHAHLMVGIRRFEKDGSWATVKDGVPDEAALTKLRERMTHKLNVSLEKHGYNVQLDQRSYEERGIDREATIHLGKHAAALERKGIETEVGNLNRDIEARNRQREIEPPDLAHENTPEIHETEIAQNGPDFAELEYMRPHGERETMRHRHEIEAERDQAFAQGDWDRHAELVRELRQAGRRPQPDPAQERLDDLGKRLDARVKAEARAKLIGDRQPYLSLRDEVVEMPEPELEPPGSAPQAGSSSRSGYGEADFVHEMEPPALRWTQHQDGYDELPAELKVTAAAFEAWQRRRNEGREGDEQGFSLHEYVEYVQGKEAERAEAHEQEAEYEAYEAELVRPDAPGPESSAIDPVTREQTEAETLWQQIEAMRPHERAAYFERMEAQQTAGVEASAQRAGLPQLSSDHAQDISFAGREDRSALEMFEQRLASQEFKDYQSDRRAAPAPIVSTMAETSDAIVQVVTLQPLARPVGRLVGRFAEMAAAAVEIAGGFLDSLFAAPDTRTIVPREEGQTLQRPIGATAPRQLQPSEPAPAPKASQTPEPPRSLAERLLAEARMEARDDIERELERAKRRHEMEMRSRRPL